MPPYEVVKDGSKAVSGEYYVKRTEGAEILDDFSSGNLDNYTIGTGNADVLRGVAYSLFPAVDTRARGVDKIEPGESYSAYVLNVGAEIHRAIVFNFKNFQNYHAVVLYQSNLILVKVDGGSVSEIDSTSYSGTVDSWEELRVRWTKPTEVTLEVDNRQGNNLASITDLIQPFEESGSPAVAIGFSLGRGAGIDLLEEEKLPEPPGTGIQFSPFKSSSVNHGNSLASYIPKTGTKTYHIGFLLAHNSSDPTPYWESAKKVGEYDYDTYISEIQDKGGEAWISFGGAVSPYVSMAADTVEEMKSAYKQAVQATGCKNIDIDEEAGGSERRKKRNQALKELQDEMGINVGFTTAASPRGMPGAAQAMIQDALDKGLEITYVNIMVMDYGNTSPDITTIKSSAEGLHDQLGTLYPSLSKEEKYAKIMLTPMIGNQDGAHTFTLDTAQKVVDYAKKRKIHGISMWSLDRDNGDCPDQPADGKASPICSGIEQEDWAFSQIFQTVQKE